MSTGVGAASTHYYADQSGEYTYAVAQGETGSLTYSVTHDGRTTYAIMRPATDETAGGELSDYLTVDASLAIGDGAVLYRGRVYLLEWWTVPNLV